MKFPELWIVAGPNGAGKTTAVQREPVNSILPGISFLNPDNRTLEKLRLRDTRDSQTFRNFLDNFSLSRRTRFSKKSFKRFKPPNRSALKQC